MFDLIDVQFFGDYLSLGGLGFVIGVVLPLGFRVVGYVVDSALMFTR